MLWEGRYKASLIDSERYLLACMRYIEMNPVRANMVQHPGDYKWSSYPCYLKQVKNVTGMNPNGNNNNMDLLQRQHDIYYTDNPTLVNELLPDLVNIGLIQRCLQNLLKEKISIKNFTLILETIADFATATKNPDEISEQVRKRLGVYFVEEYEAQ